MATVLNAAVPAAGTTIAAGPFKVNNRRDDGGNMLPVQAIFTYGSGGTTAKFYLQTTFDGGTTWIDVLCFAFATASATFSGGINKTTVAAPVAITDGALADNTAATRGWGEQFRIKQIIAGTYVTSTIKIDVAGQVVVPSAT